MRRSCRYEIENKRMTKIVCFFNPHLLERKIVMMIKVPHRKNERVLFHTNCHREINGKL